MPLKFINKAVFIIAALGCGAFYIVGHYAFGVIHIASYRIPQFLALVYIFYLPLITPFDVEYVSARIRNANYTRYTLAFLTNLTGIAAAFWLTVTAEVWLIGCFVIHDNMDFNIAIDPMIYLFINLTFLNIFHIVMCRWLKNTSVRKVMIFAVPLIQIAMHFFGSNELRLFVFMCYGTFEQPIPYIIGVYSVVFVILIFFMLIRRPSFLRE